MHINSQVFRDPKFDFDIDWLKFQNCGIYGEEAGAQNKEIQNINIISYVGH